MSSESFKPNNDLQKRFEGKMAGGGEGEGFLELSDEEEEKKKKRLEEIKAFSHSDIESLLAQKSENLKRRMNGDISGVELDQLDQEIDEKIKRNGEEGKSEMFGQLSREELLLDGIKYAPDMRNLLIHLGKHENITGSDGYIYKTEELVPIIGNLKDSNDPNLQRITSNYGLRDKVKAFLRMRETGI